MSEVIAKNKQWIDETFTKIDKKLQKVSVRSRNKLPYTAIDGVHNDEHTERPWWWTNGFWGGMMWLMYQETKSDTYKETAIKSGEMVNEIFGEYNRLDHDVGFLWHLTEGANYRITGDRKARSANLLAAASLFSRYNIDGKFIRAWNGVDADFLTIIDCMMNLSILYWASEEVGDSRFARVARAHADTTLRDHVRPDGSVNHMVIHDGETGEFKESWAGQGYAPDSCWSRGLAWAIYGFYISYAHTGDGKYLDAAKKTANYFIVNTMRTGYLPAADFRAPKDVFCVDTTASACTACALLEIAKHVSEPEGEMYREEAIKLLKAIDEKCANYDENVDYLVGFGTERCPRKEFPREKCGVEKPIIYGDFFYVEAFLKLRENDFFIW